MVTEPDHTTGTTAARRWREALAAWAIPEEILAAAPESPYGFDVGLFARIADEALDRDTPSRRIAREALPEGGSVLDIGCGGGAGALPLVPPASLVIGLDEQRDMLEAFAARAEATGVAHDEIEGAWPDAADRTPMADVVVCHNVLYNVPDLVPFARALDDHARTRVVVELHDRHPVAWLNPYWRTFHDLERPEGPTAQDARDVLTEAGIGAEIERWSRPHRWDTEDEDALVGFVRRRLCLAVDREEEVRTAVRAHPPPVDRAVATLWWTPTR